MEIKTSSRTVSFIHLWLNRGGNFSEDGRYLVFVSSNIWCSMYAFSGPESWLLMTLELWTADIPDSAGILNDHRMPNTYYFGRRAVRYHCNEYQIYLSGPTF